MSQAGLAAVDRVPEGEWDVLAGQRVYFGHMSVGDNVLAGVGEILQSRPRIKLRIAELKDPKQLDEPGLVHSKLGANCDPNSKIRGFAELMAAGVGEQASIAFFKLCYADITERTDVDQVFALYRGAFEGLSKDFPRVVFGHVTVPLTVRQAGPKALAKRLLGKPLHGYGENGSRGRYNQLMREHYGPSGRLLDVAGIEATRSDGSSESVFWNGRYHQALCPSYTDDGGHLGPLGRLVVAGELLVWLAKLGISNRD